MMCGCKKCNMMNGLLLLVVGILFLLKDLGQWTFWNISWWTIVFLLMGVGGLCMNSCKDCQAVMYGKK